MRGLRAVLAVLALAVVSPASARGGPVAITLTASDHVRVFGRFYEARNAKAIVLLFHQAGSSKDEYATIAPRLVSLGFDALAIDQRAGGSLFGSNETLARLGHEATYLDAKNDLVAALDWARSKGLPVLLWGSSYSAALVFEVAAEHPEGVDAVLAFSPGEYLGGTDPVKHAAAQVHVPIYSTSASDPDEVEAAREILDASPSRSRTQYVPRFGVHGSSTLLASRDPKGATENWSHVRAFLAGLDFAGR